MALIRNEVENISVPGFGEIPFQVRIDDSGMLTISLRTIASQKELIGGSCALGLLQRYLDDRKIPYRICRRPGDQGESYLDSYIFHDGARRATELVTMLRYVIDPDAEVMG